jgi:protoporphyrinogen IX oxidase
MDFLYIKALHIIFVVCWFAALFYIVRLFIYVSDVQTKDEVVRPALTQQLILMQKKLWYIIGWPAAIGTHIFGWWMIFLNMGYYLSQPWMWLKLIAILLLSIYHLECERVLRQQKQGIFKWTSFKLRLFNEAATVLLVAIVFLVVVKSTAGLLWGILGLLAFAAILMAAVYIYRKKSKENELKNTPPPAPPVIEPKP